MEEKEIELKEIMLMNAAAILGDFEDEGAKEWMKDYFEMRKKYPIIERTTTPPKRKPCAEKFAITPSRSEKLHVLYKWFYDNKILITPQQTATLLDTISPAAQSLVTPDITCAKCNGKGYLSSKHDGMRTIEETCLSCKGTGKVLKNRGK